MQKKNKPLHMYRQALQYVLRSCPSTFFFVVFFRMLSCFMAPFHTYILQMTIASTEKFIQGENTRNSLINIYLVLLITMVFLPFVNRILAILSNKMSYAIKEEYQNSISAKLDNIQYCHFEEVEFNDTLERIQNKHDSIVGTLMVPVNILGKIISLLGYLLIIMQIQWLMLPVIILFLIPNIYIDIRKADHNHQSNVELSEKSRYQDYLYSLFWNRKHVCEFRVFKFFPYLQKKWEDTTSSNYDSRLKVLRKNINMNFIGMFFHSIAIFASISVLIYTSRYKSVSLASFMAAYNAVESIIIIVAYQLSHSLSQLKLHWHFWNDFRDFCALEEENNQKCGETTIDETEIEFHDVFFKYPNMKDFILQGVSFQIKKGTTCAIVGENGSGKSTIVKLLLGLYKPDKGNITINGKDLSEYSKKQLNKLVAVVFQDFIKYPMTVRENIGVGNIADIDDELSIKDTLAQIVSQDTYQFLIEHFDKYLCTEYEQGIDLSEGQWQQIAIARSMLRKRPLVILDEPTAALDANIESKLYSDFKTIFSKKTCLLISHRLGCAKICDEILVLSNGKIVERGTHEELMHNKDLYSKMYLTQKGSYCKNKINQL